MKALAALLAIAAAFLAATWLLVPDGSDVQNAVKVRSEIAGILRKSGLNVSEGVNVVMMKEKRRDLAVVIRNPTPDVQSVRSAILNGLPDTIPSVTVGFRDADMKRLESWRLDLSADGRRRETKLSD